MSGANGTAPKKAAASEGSHESGAELLKKHSDLMREAGSEDGAWNPEPDDHISGMLRDDVELSTNEIKLIALVKSCCLQKKLQGRTAWGVTTFGKPLTAPRIAEMLGWDLSNTGKWVERPLAWGFIRKNEDGVFGIGASVKGKFTIGEYKAKPKNKVVRTDHPPDYLLVASKGFSKLDRENFIQGWVTRKETARKRLADEKRRLYELEIAELAAHCEAFGLKLKRRNEKGDEDEETSSVQTTFVQEEDERDENDLYGAPGWSVPTTHIRNQSRAESYRGSSSSFEVVAAAVHERIPDADDDAIAQIVHSCRRVETDASDEEIAYFVREKRIGRNVENPVGFLIAAVPRCFASRAFRDLRRVKQDARAEGASFVEEAVEMERWRREQEESLADPKVSDKDKELIRLCLGLEPAAQAQKAGQR